VNTLNDVVCFGTETGEITLSITDATYSGPFNWIIWDTNGTPVDLTDDTLVRNGTSPTNGPTGAIPLFGGDYIVEVIQNNFPQCTNTQAFTISAPSAPITGTTNVSPITCIGNDGVIEITNVAGGWGGYSYFVGTSAPATMFRTLGLIFLLQEHMKLGF